MLDKLKGFFSKKKHITTKNYTYATLPLVKQKFLHKDIISYTKQLKHYLEVGLTSEKLMVINIRPDKLFSLYVKDWVVDENRYISDINSALTEFYIISSKFEREFTKLKLMNKTDRLFFNTTRLQPYIINIENIKETLDEIKGEQV